MRLEIKNLWLKALTSGEYKQTTGALRTKSGYCCLGVLCDIYRKETGKGRWRLSGIANHQHFVDIATGKSRISMLPTLVAKWAGLVSNESDHHVSPSVTISGIRVSLASLNDNGSKFSEIAGVIEVGL